MSTLQEAADVAARAPVAEMAMRCQQLLGQRVVALATGMKSTKMVARWAAGTNGPQAAAEDRLRSLYRVVALLEANGEEPETIRAWLLGSNPSLQDRSPAELLRGNDFVPVFKAAENFIDS